MKKLLLLLALSFFSIQGFAAGCPDGSEPVKSISADGTYFVFECGNKATEGNSELGQISNTENEELQVFFEHDFKCMNQTFDKFVNVFGVMVAGSSEATLEKVIHTAGVLAQYLDNDEDGIPDDSKISSYLEKNKFIVPVWREKEREKFVKNRNGTPCQNIRMSASMYVEYDQWAIGGIQKTGTWDTNLEEVWHVVSQGWYEVYPEYFGNNINNSLILTAMNKARGGIFNTPPLKYPQNAWYTYDDETCGYFCQKSEYFYWILMANINALDPYLTDKCYYSKDEWHICNKSELKEKDVLAYELLNNYNFVLPTKIPDGKYISKEQPERESNIFDSIDEEKAKLAVQLKKINDEKKSQEEEKAKRTAELKKSQKEEKAKRLAEERENNKNNFKYSTRYFKSQLKLLESQNNVEVCDAILKEFYTGDYYSRTKKKTYFFVSLDSSGKDCHYEWSTNIGNTLSRCETNTKFDGKCTIYALGDNIVWGNPKLYKELTGKK